MFAAGKYDMVFLATDDSEAIDRFRETFGEKFVYYRDVIRSSGDETVMKSREERKSSLFVGKRSFEGCMDFRKLSGLDSRIVSGKLWRKNFKAASKHKV